VQKGLELCLVHHRRYLTSLYSSGLLLYLAFGFDNTDIMLSWEEVTKHNSGSSCWVVIRGIAYDVTTFLDDHPGGAKSILRYGGKDGTEEYESFHPLGTIEETLSSGMVFAPISFIFNRQPRTMPWSCGSSYNLVSCTAPASPSFKK
jgi:hypothetical protein